VSLRSRPVEVDPRRRDACFRSCDLEHPCLECVARDWAMFPWPRLCREEWAILRSELMSRSGGACEVCGRRFGPGEEGMSAHHRRNRGRGGTDDPTINGLANLLAVCGGRMAGTVGCHGLIEANRDDAVSNGWIVEHGGYVAGAGEPPEVAVPVLLPMGRWYLVPLSGRYSLTA
jgi:hypothetical protein